MKKYSLLSILSLFLVACSVTPSNSDNSSSPVISKYAKGELVYTYESKGNSRENEDIEIKSEKLKDHKVVYKIDRDNNTRSIEFDTETLDLDKWSIDNAYIGDIDFDNSLDFCMNLKISGSSAIKERALFYSFEKKKVIYEANEKYDGVTHDSYIINVNKDGELILDRYIENKNVSIYPLKYARFLNNKQEITLEWADYSLAVYNIEPDFTDPEVQNNRTHENGNWGFVVSKNVEYSVYVFADLVGDINDTITQYQENAYFTTSYDENYVEKLSVIVYGGNIVYTEYKLAFKNSGTTSITFTMMGYSSVVSFVIQ